MANSNNSAPGASGGGRLLTGGRLAALGLIACASLLSSGFARSGVDTAPGALSNWGDHGAAADESGYSRLTEINRATIGRLGLAWSLDLPDERGVLEATPLEVDGTLYFTGSHGAVHAVDALSGKLKWRYDPEVWKVNPAKLRNVLGVNRGAAYAAGRVFSATLDGRLIALDAASGKLLWSVETVSPLSFYTITGAPRTFNGKVIIGQGGGDAGSRGFVTAYDQKTGKQVWRFYTAPGSPEQNRGDPAMDRAAATWSGEYWKTGTGGTAWDGMTFDPELNRVYIGAGNSGPYDPDVRSPGNGDNLYLTSIIAVDADTGKYIWHYQMNPREAWDYKATANIITATLTIGGKPRQVLMQSPTNGFFYVIDRETGKLLSAEKTGKVTWADHIDLATGRPVEAPNIRYEKGEVVMWPSVLGTHNWQAMSFSPATGLVYIPTVQLGMRFTRVKPGPGILSFGGISEQVVVADKDDGKGALLAWDPVAQKPRWKIPRGRIANGGTMATAGGLVFQGTADGAFTAYDALSGQQLWRFDAGLGIVSPPISYAIKGHQYVSVLVGYGGSNMIGGDFVDAGWKYGAQPRRMLTFRLDGKAKLPPTAPPDRTVHAVDDPAIAIDEADIAPGRYVFTMRCAMCHGLDAVSAGAPAPDLRESAVAMNREAFRQVVAEGASLPHGMPRFEMLGADELRQLHAYIRAMTREALGTRKPSGPQAAVPARN